MARPIGGPKPRKGRVGRLVSLIWFVKWGHLRQQNSTCARVVTRTFRRVWLMSWRGPAMRAAVPRTGGTGTAPAGTGVKKKLIDAPSRPIFLVSGFGELE